MSVPPVSSGWQHRGDGFSGVQKFSRLLPPDVDRSTPAKNRTTASIDDEIVTETTSKAKSKGISCTNNMSDVPSAVWKRRDFLQDFDISISQGVASKAENINWSSSSSDECSPVVSYPGIRNRVLRDCSRRKRKHRSPRGIDSSCEPQSDSDVSVSPRASHDFSYESQSVTRDNITAVTSVNSLCASGGCVEGQDCPVGAVSSPGSSLLTSAKNVSNVRSATISNLHYRTREKRNKMSWTLSSFDDVKQMSSPTMGTLPVTQSHKLKLSQSHKLKLSQSHKLKLSHGSFSRCRSLGSRVQKSYVGASQESIGQISDVESDTETDTLDIDPDLVGSDIETLSSHNTSISDRQQSNDSLPANVQEDEPKGSQVDISSGLSSPSSSSHSQKMCASEWLKALQTQNTPEKGDHSMNCQQDSAKKKRKFARGSMAEQLTRLINREKASVRFWHHSVNSATFCDTTSRSLLLRLQSLEKQYSLFMSQCHLMYEGGGSKPCRAMFLSETVKMLSLKPGMLVQVFAPWQQLEEDSGMQTFLCTHFVRICPDVNPEHGHTQADLRYTTSSSAVWKCPCCTDPHLHCHACQAAVCPVVPLQTWQLKTASGAGSSVGHSATLHTVSALPNYPGVSCEPRRTLLESLEGMRGDSSLIPPFSASVLRVFRHRGKDTWKHRFQLLVEDAAGTLAIIRLSDESEDSQKTAYKAEGKTYTFSHIQVISRTNRDKEPALFRIIDQVWTRQFVDMSSQQSDSDASQIQVPVAAPGFAYVLHSVSDVMCCMYLDPGAVVKDATVKLITLKEALQNCSETRVSFVARVLLPAGFSQASGPSTVFVYDTSVNLEGGNTAVQRVEVGSECVMENSSTGLYLFRDVSLHKGHWQCDSYTLVLEMAAWSSWNMCQRVDNSMVMARTVKLPPVCDMSEASSLVSLEGVISGVNEDQAYSWEECETCGSDKLATLEESGTIYCTGCNSQVKSPVVRMKMEVYVTCQSLLSTDLHVQLDVAQATIDSLLPSEHSDQGFDTEQVIGKYIRCPACLVLSRVSDSSTDACKHPKISLILTELTFNT